MKNSQRFPTVIELWRKVQSLCAVWSRAQFEENLTWKIIWHTHEFLESSTSHRSGYSASRTLRDDIDAF